MSAESFYDSVKGVALLVRLQEPAITQWIAAADEVSVETYCTDQWEHCHVVADGRRPTCLVAPTHPAVDPRLVDPTDPVYRNVPMIAIATQGSELDFWRHLAWNALTAEATHEERVGSLQTAYDEALRRRREWDLVEDFHRRRDTLSQDELVVLGAVCDGKLNKQIAGEQGVSVRTVEQRRRRVFAKMGVDSAVPLADWMATVRTLERRFVRHDHAQQAPAPKGLGRTPLQQPARTPSEAGR